MKKLRTGYIYHKQYLAYRIFLTHFIYNTYYTCVFVLQFRSCSQKMFQLEKLNSHFRTRIFFRSFFDLLNFKTELIGSTCHPDLSFSSSKNALNIQLYICFANFKIVNLTLVNISSLGRIEIIF